MKLACFAVACVLAPVHAGAQHLPAIRQLGSIIATSAESLGAVVSVRHLPSGVLVNDPSNRRIVMLDSALANPIIVADSTPATGNAYSTRMGSLIAYRGDSSLFIDPQSLSMLVIDGSGKVGRVMSVPRSQDAMVLGNPMIGGAAYDGAGRLVYRGFGMPRFQMRAGGGGSRGGGAAPMPPEFPDSSAIVRVDIASRQLDTAAFVRIPRIKMEMQRDEASGRVSISGQMNPLPTVDEWAVLSDGSIAVVRGRDYHVDFIRPDGTRETAAKMPFEWQRLTDEDKVAFIDSVTAARERLMAEQPPAPPATGTTTTTSPDGGTQRRQMVVMGAPVAGATAGADANMMLGRNVTFVAPSELPDYKPPFLAGSVRADQDGNLWILTIPTRGIAGGPVYDVVNAKGRLVERVQLPEGRTVVGFGADEVVYLAVRTGAKTTLERARVR